MATYAIGDLHGCLDELHLLLEKINFDNSKDTLWFAGDLVNINGNNKSMEVLQFLKNLGEQHVCVLGNHDLGLLGMAYGKVIPDEKIGFDLQSVLDFPNKEELLDWLQSRSLVHYDSKFNVLLVHAGLAPQWSIEKVLILSREVETILRNKQQSLSFFEVMFGDDPKIWSDSLTSNARARCILNYITRLRFCSQDGEMDFVSKGPSHERPPNMMPWFEVPNRLSRDTTVIFGHWAALVGQTSINNVIALDTGCVWGAHLSAIRLEDHCMFMVDSKQRKQF